MTGGFANPLTDRPRAGTILRVSQPVVDIRGLHVRFGEVEAVAGIDVQAHAGQATALLGRNGAGKSTTMRVLAGLVPPTAGSVHRRRPRHPHAHPGDQAAQRVLPGRRRPRPTRDAVGAPPALGPAAAPGRLGGPRPRPPRAVRARRRRPPDHRWLQPRHGPAPQRRPRLAARAPAAAARRALRRCRPHRRRGHHGRHRRRPRPWRLHPRLHPPARAGDPGVQRRHSSSAAARASRRSAPPRWRGRRGPVPTGLSSTSAAGTGHDVRRARRRSTAAAPPRGRRRRPPACASGSAPYAAAARCPLAVAILGGITLAACTLPMLAPRRPGASAVVPATCCC